MSRAIGTLCVPGCAHLVTSCARASASNSACDGACIKLSVFTGPSEAAGGFDEDRGRVYQIERRGQTVALSHEEIRLVVESINNDREHRDREGA